MSISRRVPRRYRAGILFTGLGLLLGVLAGARPHQPSFTRFQNRWKPAEFLHVERGPLESGAIDPGWWSADWILEPAEAPFVRIRNRYRGNVYIHIERGRVEAGPIDQGWWSAQWQLDRNAEGFVEIRNRWKPNEYLHNENGAIACGPIQRGWWSAQWTVHGGPTVAQRPAPQPAPQPAQQPAPVARPQPQPSPGQSAANLAQQAIFGPSDPDICWKDTYGRGVGEPITTCAAGQEKDGALCYPACRDGFGGAGPVCWRRCPAGFTDIGVSCSKPAAYGRGTGYAYNPFVGEGRAAAQRRCENAHGAGNCERSLEMFYPRCRSGYRPVGSNICSPVCPGGFRDDGAFCAKESYGRGAGSPLTCRAGTELSGAICYSPCRPGTTGVGPVCWASCPANFPVNCGAACAVSSAACAFAVLDQVESSSGVALNVASLVTTGGAATPALRAAQAAGRSARRNLTAAARQQLKRQASDQLQNAMQWQRRQANVSRAQGWLDNAENLDQAAELMVSAYEKGEFDFTALTPSLADVEPTGVLAMVRSFNKPICGR